MQTNNSTRNAIGNAHKERKQTMQANKQTQMQRNNANKECKTIMQTNNAQQLESTCKQIMQTTNAQHEANMHTKSGVHTQNAYNAGKSIMHKVQNIMHTYNAQQIQT